MYPNRARGWSCELSPLYSENLSIVSPIETQEDSKQIAVTVVREWKSHTAKPTSFIGDLQ